MKEKDHFKVVSCAKFINLPPAGEAMGQKSRLGLPILTERTYQEYKARVQVARQNCEGIVRLLKELEQGVRHDPLYEQLTRWSAARYPADYGESVRIELLTAHYLLSREGEIPILDQERFEARWYATMDPRLAVMNVGLNMDMIDRDNRVFGKFVRDSTIYFPDMPTKMLFSSDASSAYMFLVDSAETGR